VDNKRWIFDMRNTARKGATTQGCPYN
jgi:hypothetical protein